MARRAHTLVGVVRTKGEEVGMPLFATVAQAEHARDYMLKRLAAVGDPTTDIPVLEGFVSTNAVEKGMATRFTVSGGIDPLTTFLEDVVALYKRPGTSN